MPQLYLKTFGCQMNVYDSERMVNLLKPLSYELTDDIESADLILFNTCTVREKAKHKFLSDLGYLKGLKKEKKNLIIGMGGCVAQEEGDRLLKRIPHLDIVFGVDQVDELCEIVKRVQETRERVSMTAFDTDPKFSLSYLRREASPVSAFITIIKGCDKFCSFCIVPFTRGREKSRSPREILREIESMVNSGTCEVTLLGQNVNSYQYEGTDFSKLLRMVDQIEGLKRIRFTSPHPQDFGDDMIDCYSTLTHVCPHLHLPVQSGNNRVLEKMKRSYTIEQYIEKIKKLREQVPDVAISTDLIVGFPTETQEEFEDTLNLMQMVQYDSIFSFKYSERVGTYAARKYADDIIDEIKEKRLEILQAKQNEISLSKNEKLVGRTVEVLVEKISKDQRLQGRTDTNKLVHFEGSSKLMGQFIQVRIHKALPHSLLGACT